MMIYMGKNSILLEQPLFFPFSYLASCACRYSTAGPLSESNFALESVNAHNYVFLCLRQSPNTSAVIKVTRGNGSETSRQSRAPALSS
jgi:hypothetical protein